MLAGLAASVTWKVRPVATLFTVGSPAISPVVGFKDRPAGSTPLVSAHV
jgi:hypothetical protein